MPSPPPRRRRRTPRTPDFFSKCLSPAALLHPLFSLTPAPLPASIPSMPATLTPRHLDHYSSLYLASRFPLIQGIAISCDAPVENAVLSLSFSPDFMEPMRWELGRLEPGEHQQAVPCGAYDPARLAALQEAAPGRAEVELRSGRELVAEASFAFTWLPGNVWAGARAFPELLAALILPNDPAVDRLLSMGADVLQRNGLSPSWRGYRAERNAIVNQVHALWEAMEQLQLTYALPPRSWHEHGSGQKLRTPSQILAGGCATCLDTTAYFAAALAQAGFNPLVVLLPGHAFVGVMLRDEVLPEPIERHAATLRNMVELGEVLLMETTLATRREEPGRVGFEAAVAAANSQLRALEEQEHFIALDVVRLWATGIRPTVAGPPQTVAALPEGAPQPPLPEGEAGAFLSETSAAEREAAMSLVQVRKRSRMENWQLKLLDLSLRNNLLNAKVDRSQITLLLPSVAQLEDALAGGKGFRICNLPDTFGTQVLQEMAESPAKLRQELMPLAEDMFRKQQLLAVDKVGEMTAQRLERRVYSLYIGARHDMEESGSNTLNLACGFLKWFRKGDEERALYAPLLLIPVTLKRPSVKAGFTLRSGDNDPSINLTLLELLKTEYGIRIPELEGELPQDESGVDVPAILQIVRQAIRSCPGWEVVDQCTLGIFSFAKYLMWLDLAERQQALMQNPIVQHLAASEPTVFPTAVDFPSPETLDEETTAKEVFTPLSADSSQLAAVLAAARGKNFVLIGPPGTGKSQTIANMVAHCLGQGKTVLFVAEKSAALSVVYRRLCRIGLGTFCLELHSNKANKKDVIAQFAAAVEQANTAPARTSWEQVAERVQQLRESLNALPDELHRPYADGHCLYEDIGLLAASPERIMLSPCPEDACALTAEGHEAMRQQARTLALRFAPVADCLPGAGEGVRVGTYSTGWDENTASALQTYAQQADTMERDEHALLAALGLDAAATLPHRDELDALLDAASQCCGQDMTPLLPARAEASLAALRAELAQAEAYRAAQAKLSLAYPDEALDEPQLDQWLREWKMGQLSNFISRFFTSRRIRKQLQVLAFTRQKPDCMNDLTQLIAMRNARQALREGQQADRSLPQYRKGTDTTAEDLAAAEHWAGRLQDVCQLTAQAERWLASRADNPVAPGKPAAALHATRQENAGQHARLGAQLAQLLQSGPPAFAGQAAPLRRWAEALLALRPQWRALTLWNEQAQASTAAGYAPMVSALMSHSVAPDELETVAEWNLSRLRARATIEDSPTLSRFTREAQEQSVNDFATQDSKLLSSTAAQLQRQLTERAAAIHEPAHRKELAYLQHEISKQRAHKAPRTLLANTPRVSRLLKPCMLMSPLSVAQYLSPESEPFDIVIFDEASQIPIWDAIGAIGRGQSAVIVGDPRQMPPTSFFARAKNNNEASDEDDGEMEDMESILDECIACGIPKMNLSWHYRSKAESLIAFSNRNYYEGKLVTFPAPVTRDEALQYHRVKGTYLRGSQRTNPVEARALVEHILQTLKAPGFRYTEGTSIGIVTFNTQQQKLISDMLERCRAEDESLEPYFAEDNPEAIFVKNLENVQGDERGCIYFSTTFGPDDKGVISMNFGPLNGQGGERRLNVAITRARAAMHVFSSLAPEDINLNRTKARGAADLRHFLECASMGAARYFGMTATGGKPGDSGNSDSSGTPAPQGSDLNRALCAQLEARGWHCLAKVGVSAYRIDIAIEHPQHPGSMLAGILLDGPTYHAASTARDRDILRESVLTGLGWNLLHLWSLDWWHNPAQALEQLDQELRRLAKQGPPQLPQLPQLPELVG